MLRIYSVALSVVEQLKVVMDQVERSDGDLARQMRRAAASVALNIAEGMYSQGKNRRARYHTALGSMRETLSCIEIAERLYGIGVTAGVKGDIDHVLGTLFKLTH